MSSADMNPKIRKRSTFNEERSEDRDWSSSEEDEENQLGSEGQDLFGINYDLRLGQILDALKASTKPGSKAVMVDNLDLSNTEDLQQFLRDNRSCLEHVTSYKKENLLHLIAETHKRSLPSVDRLRPLLRELIGLPSNLLGQKDYTDKTPLFNAIAINNHKLVQVMCDAYKTDSPGTADNGNNGTRRIDDILHIDVGKRGTSLHRAIGDKVFSKHVRTLLTLISHSGPKTLCALDEHGRTPLHLAVEHEKCNDSQIQIVKALLEKCDEAMDRGSISPYRHHLITCEEAAKAAEEDAVKKQKDNKERVFKGKPDFRTKEKGHSHRKMDKKPDRVPEKAKTHDTEYVLANNHAYQAEIIDSDLPTGKYSGDSITIMSSPAVAPTVEDGTRDIAPPALLVGREKKRATNSSEANISDKEPTKKSLDGIRQYLKGCCLRRDHENAVQLLYGTKQEKQIYFDLSGVAPVISEDRISAGLEHLKFEDILQYVAIPQITVEVEKKNKPRQSRIAAGQNPRSRQAPQEGKGRSDFKAIFGWLRSKNVNEILRVIVDDLQEPSHSEEAIEDCFERISGIVTWEWMKFDLCPSVIASVAPCAQVIHLYWSGNNVVLRGWSEPQGLPAMKELKKIHLHKRQGLESTKRMQRNITEFKTRMRKHSDIEVEEDEIRQNLTSTPANGIDPAGEFERHQWVETMEKFAVFLQNAERNAEPKVELSKPVTVAVIDDGVDTIDPEIQSRIIGGRTFCYRDKMQNLNQPYYVSGGGHGTAMSGFICKICPNVKLYILRLQEHISYEGRRQITADSAERAVRTAVEFGVDIISMSWTIEKNDDNKEGVENLERAIAEAASKNILMFCAARDQGANEKVSYPAATAGTKNIFKIGGAEASGNKMKWLGGDINDVDFIFPGYQVVRERYDDPTVKKHTALTGSSVATALASGLAAVILYCVQLECIASDPKTGMETYHSTKTHARIKEIFSRIGTTKESEWKYITVWKEFDEPEKRYEQEKKLRPRMYYVRQLATRLLL